MLALDARGLTRTFGTLRAVDGLSLHVQEGEVLGLLGPNGAGKSTTVAMLTTLLRPTLGEATVAGHDLLKEPHAVRARIGVVFQGPSLELQLTARQNLRYHARLYHLEGWEARAEELLRRIELHDRADEPVQRFSGGMRRRLEIARALLHKPRMLFLDEPTVGLDPQARLHIFDLLRDLRRDERMAILLTTHHMDEADALSDRVAIMDKGRLLQVDTAAGLKASLGGDVVRLRAASRKPLEAALAGMDGAGGLRGVAWRDDTAEVTVADASAALPLLLKAAGRHRAKLEKIEVHVPTLEDVFIARTGRALRDEP